MLYEVITMLKQALADPDPVIIFEHIMLYGNSDSLPESGEIPSYNFV